MGTQNHGYKLKIENFRLQSISKQFQAFQKKFQFWIISQFKSLFHQKFFKDFFFKIFKIKDHEIFSNLSYKKFREYLRNSISPISLII